MRKVIVAVVAAMFGLTMMGGSGAGGGFSPSSFGVAKAEAKSKKAQRKQVKKTAKVVRKLTKTLTR